MGGRPPPQYHGRQRLSLYHFLSLYLQMFIFPQQSRSLASPSSLSRSMTVLLSCAQPLTLSLFLFKLLILSLSHTQSLPPPSLLCVSAKTDRNKLSRCCPSSSWCVSLRSRHWVPISGTWQRTNNNKTLLRISTYLFLFVLALIYIIVLCWLQALDPKGIRTLADSRKKSGRGVQITLQVWPIFGVTHPFLYPFWSF